MVRIRRSHRRGPGSIPGQGTRLLLRSSHSVDIEGGLGGAAQDNVFKETVHSKIKST